MRSMHSGPARASQELLEGERFGQVIIGSQIETFDTVRDCVFGRKDEHVCRVPLGPDAREDGQPIHSRKHQVEGNDIIIVAGGVP